MAMTFATETLKAVIHGGARERVPAILKFLMWFAAASFVASTLLLYVGSIENAWLSAAIGAVISAIVSFLKFGH